ncbi:MAG: NAD(P)H-binding protein [Terriglobia bacterium]
MGCNVLVVGGTRGTGLEITRLLVASGYGVRASSRDPGSNSLVPGGVELVQADVTDSRSLEPVVADVDHVVCTVGVTKKLASESEIRTTEYDGVANLIAATKNAGLPGRFMYMNSIGVKRHSAAAALLNTVKGNTLVWRGRAEEALRQCGLRYTIVRAGFLNDDPGGVRAVELRQDNLPLRRRYRISREDVAQVFSAALGVPQTEGATLDAVWAGGKNTRRGNIFGAVRRDATI